MSDGTTSAVDDQCVWSADLGTFGAMGGYSAPVSIAATPSTDVAQCDLGAFSGTANITLTSPQLECENGGGSYYNNFCWKVAAQTADSCDDVCSTMSLSCSTDPDWMVDDTLCGQLTGGGGLAGTVDATYSPVEFFGTCKNDADNNRNCSDSATVPYNRICKCE